MDDSIAQNAPPQKRALYFKDGKIYFTRRTERRFFFFLTLLMLMVGICFKLGFI